MSSESESIKVEPIPESDSIGLSVDDQAPEEHAPQVLTAEVVEPVAEQITAAIMRSSWQGRLPPPKALSDFDEVVPGAARAIIDDMLEDGKREDRALSMDHNVSMRVLDIMQEDADGDRDFRLHVFDWLRPVFVLPFIFALVALFAPIGDAAKTIVIVASLVVAAAPFCIALLRGRMTKNESDVITKVIPEIVAAVRGAVHTEVKIDDKTPSIEPEVGPRQVERGVTPNLPAEPAVEPPASRHTDT